MCSWRMQVNHRQGEKRYKRKWQCMFADYMFQILKVKVKPSRIKMRVWMQPHTMTIKGMSRGYELKIEFTDKKEEAADGLDDNE